MSDMKQRLRFVFSCLPGIQHSSHPSPTPQRNFANTKEMSKQSKATHYDTSLVSINNNVATPRFICHNRSPSPHRGLLFPLSLLRRSWIVPTPCGSNPPSTTSYPTVAESPGSSVNPDYLCSCAGFVDSD